MEKLKQFFDKFLHGFIVVLNIITIWICLDYNKRLKFDNDFLYVKQRINIGFSRNGFVKLFYAHMDPGLRYFFIGMASVFVISIFLRKYNVILVNTCDVIAYLMTAVGMGVYLLLIMYCTKVTITLKKPDFFATIGFVLFCGIVQLLDVLRDRKLTVKQLEADSDTKEKLFQGPRWIGIPFAVIALGAVIAYGVKIGGAWREYNAFKENYGCYFEMQKLTKKEQPQEQRNYMNNAVVVDGEIYFAGDLYHSNESGKSILWKVTKDGKVEPFIELDDNDESQDLDTFVYADGYIYSIWSHQGGESLVRISMDGSMEVVGEDEIKHVSFLYCLDGKIIYSYSKDGDENFYCVDAKDIMDLSKHKLYLPDINPMQSVAYADSIARLYLSIMCGEERDLGEYSRGYEQYLCRNDGWYYYILRDTNSRNVREANCLPGDFVRYQLGDKNKETIDEGVTEYNFSEDALYYAVATENGAEIIKANLDGSNKEVIYSREDGTRCQKIVVSDDYVLVRMSNVHTELDLFDQLQIAKHGSESELEEAKTALDAFVLIQDDVVIER